MFPIEAAVMPLPREETTPPVTKTYFDMDDLQGGFTDFTGKRTRRPHLASPHGGEGPGPDAPTWPPHTVGRDLDPTPPPGLPTRWGGTWTRRPHLASPLRGEGPG